MGRSNLPRAHQTAARVRRGGGARCCLTDCKRSHCCSSATAPIRPAASPSPGGSRASPQTACLPTATNSTASSPISSRGAGRHGPHPAAPSLSGEDCQAIAEVDRLAEAGTPSAEMRDRSRRAGRALLGVWVKLDGPLSVAYRGQVSADARLGHLPVAQAVVGRDVRRRRAAQSPPAPPSCPDRRGPRPRALFSQPVRAADHVQHDLVGARADAVQAHVAPTRSTPYSRM